MCTFYLNLLVTQLLQHQNFNLDLGRPCPSAVIRRSNEFKDFWCHKGVKVSLSVTLCNIYIIPQLAYLHFFLFFVNFLRCLCPRIAALLFPLFLLPRARCLCHRLKYFSWCNLHVGVMGDLLIEFFWTKVSLQLPRKRPNSSPSFSAFSITQSEMFMPMTEIFFLVQTPCRIDGRPLDWIFLNKSFPSTSSKTAK
jgi:hypothetical protein